MVFKNTMKNAPKSVIMTSAAWSRLWTDSRAYWPTPWRSKTVSVRMAPPPSTAPKSSPQSVTMGIIELRSTWRRITWRSERPLARAVRTKSSFMVSSTFERSTRE